MTEGPGIKMAHCYKVRLVVFKLLQSQTCHIQTLLQIQTCRIQIV